MRYEIDIYVRMKYMIYNIFDMICDKRYDMLDTIYEMWYMRYDVWNMR
jgi:hypothetical protein